MEGEHSKRDRERAKEVRWKENTESEMIQKTTSNVNHSHSNTEGTYVHTHVHAHLIHIVPCVKIQCGSLVRSEVKERGPVLSDVGIHEVQPG